MQLNYVLSSSELPENIKSTLAEAPVFYSPGYEKYTTINNGIPIYIFNDSYIMLFTLYKSFFFRYIIIPAEYVILKDDGEDALRAFLDECIYLLKRKFNIHWIEPTSAASNIQVCPTKCLKIPFGSYIVDLTQSEESLWTNVNSKHKNIIRKARKLDVEIRYGKQEYLDDYLKLDSDTWERSEKEGHKKEYFRKMFEALGEEIICFMAYKDSLPQGGAIYFFNRYECYCMFAASKNQPEPGSMNLLHWEAMLNMRERGIKKYSLVGCRINEDPDSKYHYLQRFKSKFGGKLVVGLMFKVVTNVFMYQAYRLMVSVRNREKYRDVIDQEIHKWQDMNNSK